VGNHYVKSINRSALKDCDKRFSPSTRNDRLTKGRALQKRRCCLHHPNTCESNAAGL